MRRLIPILLAVLLIAGLTYAFWPRAVPVDVGQVVRGDLEVTVDEEGKTRIKERYTVSAPLGGRLRRIELDPGDEVRAGKTLLAVIEPNDPALLDKREQAEAEARVKAADASLQQATPRLEAARAGLEYAQSEFRRKRTLKERGGITESELEDAELLVRTRSQELKAAEFAVQIAKFELEQAQAALVRSRPDAADLDDDSSETEGSLNNAPSTAAARSAAAPVPRIEIRSPITGRVLHVLEESAGVVTAGTGLIEVGNPVDLEIEIDVLSSDAVAIKPGALVRLVHWGGEYPLEGSVRLVEPAAFTKVSALGVEEQRVDVVVDFTDPPEKRTALGDGYRVEARIVVWQGEDIVKVPASALFRQGDDWAVFRVVGDRAVFTPIKLGHSNALEGEVLEGLSAGDVVIVHPSDTVVDGVKVIRR
ncbi:MAG: HlyD family efflux transporter periplasmic adaptor subunit [Pirellulales bacterium]|nr:HlyD family efflux transporter periplasmic adaptor subunit [Pirellulales bacterium]